MMCKEINTQSLPFLRELLEETIDNNEPSIIGDYNFSGYYTLNNNHSYQMIFCSRCGEYIMANSIDSSFITTCQCQLIYPHNMLEETRLISVQQNYKQMKIVLQELYNKFTKNDMLKITNFIIEFITHKQIIWI
jgi:hypothetical protein